MNANDAKGRKDKTQGESEQKGQKARSLAPTRSQSLNLFQGAEPFQRLRNEFDRLFDRLLPAWAGGGEFRDQNGWNLDIKEDNDSVAVRAEAPGFEPSDFDIQVRGNQLVLCACHQSQTEEKGDGFHEWQSREFYRSVPLPAGVDSSHIEATYRQGVLNVTLPKTEEGKGRRIEVKS